MTTYDAGSVKATADLDRDPFINGLRACLEQGREFSRQRFTATAAVDDVNARRQLEQMRLLMQRIDGQRVHVRVDTTGLDRARADLERLRAEQARVNGQQRNDLQQTTRAVHSAAESQKNDFNLIRVAIEQLAPPLVPFAGGVAALIGSVAKLGVAGILAFKGISAEIKAGTPLGIQYAGVLGGLKTDLSALEKISARGVLSGFTDGVSRSRLYLPAFREDLRGTSRELGDIADHVMVGLVGGFTAFSGAASKGVGYIDHLAAAFESWATGPGGASFAKTISTDLDHLIPVLGQLGTLAVHLISAVHPIGTVMLDDLGMLAEAINGIPVGVLQAAAAAYLTFRTVTSVTAGINAATAALRGFAGAENAAAVASVRLGESSAAGGAAGGLSRRALAISALTRGLAVGAGIYVGGTMLRGLGRNSSAYNEPGGINADWLGTYGGGYGSGAALTSGLGNLLTGNFSAGWSDLFGAHRNAQVAYGRNVEADRADASYFQIPGTLQAARNHLLGTIIYGGENYGEGMTTRGGFDSEGHLVTTWGRAQPTLQQQFWSAKDAYNARFMAGANQTQGLFDQQQARPGDINQQAAAYNGINDALQKSITARQKWLALGGPEIFQYKGLSIGENTYRDALARTNGDRAKAQGLIEASIDSMNHNQTLLEVNSDRQQRLNDAIAGAADKYHLTTAQVSQYASLMGITADKVGRGEVSQRSFVAAIGQVAHAIGNAQTNVQGWAAAVDAFTASADTAASRGQLIGAALVAANGDALSFQNTMVGAAVANQQVVTELGKVHRGLINLKTGTIDYHNAAAAPLLNALQQLQTANMNAAAAVYQHELATKGGKKAADDAYQTYVNNTRGALIDEAQHFGMNADQAKRFADQYFGLSHAKDLKKQIELIGKDQVQVALGKILKVLEVIAGMRPKPVVGLEDLASTPLARLQAMLSNLNNKHFTYYVDGVVHGVTNTPGGGRHQDVPATDAGSHAVFGGKVPPNTRFTVGETAWEGAETDAAGRVTIYSNAQARRRGYPDPRGDGYVRRYAAGSGETGGYTGVDYGTGSGSSGSSSSGSSSSSSGAAGSKSNPIKKRKRPRLFLFRGLWYEGRDAYDDAVAEWTSQHKQAGQIVAEPHHHGYGYRGTSYDKRYEALNAETEWMRSRAWQRHLTDQAATGSKLYLPHGGHAAGAALRALYNLGTSAIMDRAGRFLDVAKTAEQHGAVGEGWIKRFEQDTHTLGRALQNRDRWISIYKNQMDRVRALGRARNDEARQIRDTAMSGFDIGTSGNGYAKGIDATLDQTIKDDSKFLRLRARAEKMGLDPKLIEQISKEGPAAAGANLEAIVNGGKAYIDEINSKYDKLRAVAGKIGKAQAHDDYADKIAKAEDKARDDRRNMLTATHTTNKWLERISHDMHDLHRKIAEQQRQHGRH